jgi:hypothetical protein
VQRLPEGLQQIEAPLQIRGKLRFMLIIGDLAIVSENAVEDLLRFQGVEHRFQA